MTAPAQPTRRTLLRSLAASAALVGTGAVLAPAAQAVCTPVYKQANYSLDRSATTPFMRAVTRPKALDYQRVDANGVLLFTYNGKRMTHPVNSSWYLLYMMASYRLNGDRRYLDRVLATAADLHRSTSYGANGTAWFPYRFPHTPGGLTNGLPWYSGMAQGMVLSCYVELADVTGSSTWTSRADAVFRSFLHERHASRLGGSPWFVLGEDRDGHRFTYLEEYPTSDRRQLSHVVNGNMYSLWGLYDYYRMTGSTDALTLFRRVAASQRDSFHLFRRPGQPSWYAMTPWGHQTWKYPTSYHRGVAHQLKIMGDLTGDGAFHTQSQTLTRDWSPPR